MRTHVALLAGLLTATMFGVEGAEARQQQRAERLLDEFESTTVFWRQFEVVKKIVSAGERGALSRLEPWLVHEDRHLRGNAAFILAASGDTRGFEAIRLMLADRSARPEGQGVPGGRFSLVRQIQADRYYAVHLLGALKNPRALESLIPLLDDSEINHKVAWALGEIADARAKPPLIAALWNTDALVRVSAIHALVKLRATEALPKLRELLGDHAMPSAGDRVTVAETARAAIATLRLEP